VGLTDRLLRLAAGRPHVLIATTPTGTETRLASEAELRRRGWLVATTPTDADVLLVTGLPHPELTDALEGTWRGVPAPRVRLNVESPDAVISTLEAGLQQLTDLKHQRIAAEGRSVIMPAEPEGTAHHDGPAKGGHRHHHDTGRPDIDDTAPDDGQHPDDMPGHDDMSGAGGHGMRGHGGHDMGGMGMPAGLPMADRGEDRDGLSLDRLHVPLGPFLPDWPAGLVVHATLQGDVVQAARLQVFTGTGTSFWDEPWRRALAGEQISLAAAARRKAAAYLDSLGRLLAVAGWAGAASTARWLRDDLLEGEPAARLAPRLQRFGRQVAHSRPLAWSTRGLGVLTIDDAVASGITGPALRAGGDVPARYRRWVSELLLAATWLEDGSPLDPVVYDAPRGRLTRRRPPSAALLTALPWLLTGVELAAARLIVASLDPDLDQLGPPPAGMQHG